jgi:hypothetical protein
MVIFSQSNADWGQSIRNSFDDAINKAYFRLYQKNIFTQSLQDIKIVFIFAPAFDDKKSRASL